ncbi:immunoglobulin superfamily DCC subclass member 3-like [Liolophura sinensis]|uniref:immunoglobulin superfamily DCC subclass member 3-like n=1 Tax=Liolophura sinensis TaxID=3198878 RepID=UPI0031590D34
MGAKLSPPAEIVKRFDARPEKQTHAIGGVARFECGINGARDTRLLWEKVERNTNLNGERFKKFSGILQIADLQESDSGPYRCLQLSKATNLKMSSEAELTVEGAMKRKAPEIIAGPANTTINTSLKKTAILECLAEGNPKPHITWHRRVLYYP